MRLAFVRHAEPQASLDGVVAGHRGCSGLSELGRRQAHALAARLEATGELNADLVVTSVLARAVETAAELARVIGPAVEDCDTCELHPGSCDGLLWRDHADRYPTEAAPDRPFSPGGESLRTFDRRVRSWLHELIEQTSHQNVVIVGHSGVIEAATLFLLDAPGLADARPFRVDSLRYTSITEWDRADDRRWRLERYNDAAHLAGIPLASDTTAWRA